MAQTKDDALVAVLESLVTRLEKLEQARSLPQTTNMDEVRAKMFADLRGADRPLPPSLTVPGCKSEDSEATFDLICEAKWIGDGRTRVQTMLTKELGNYKHDPRREKHIVDGGFVPDRMPIDPNDKSEGGYAMWLSNFWREDLKRLVGREPLPSMVKAAQERAKAA